MARPVAAWGSLPFAEQIAFFKGKLNLPTQTWQDLLGAAHDRAFVVAGAMRADLLADLHAATLKGIEKGTSLSEFRRDFEAIVAKRGWTGWTGEDTPGGRAWRQEIIYGTNMRTSYQAGRHAQAVAIAHRRPYWRWRHADTVAHPRPLHVAWDGKILRYDNPWWQAHWPPAGWLCRCRVETLSQSDLERLGKSGPDPTPDDGTYEWLDKAGNSHTIPNGIDPGWDYTPGSTRDLIAEVKAKAAGLPEALGKALVEEIAQKVAVETGWHQPPPDNLDDVIERGRLREEELLGSSSKNFNKMLDRIKKISEEQAALKGNWGHGNVKKYIDLQNESLALREKAESYVEKILAGMRRQVKEGEKAAWTKYGLVTPSPSEMAARLKISGYDKYAKDYLKKHATAFYRQFGVNAANVNEVFFAENRAWYRASDGAVNMGNTANDISVLFHEFGHGVENRLDVAKLCQEWIKRRATGPLASLNDITGLTHYDAWEQAYPDTFVNPYVGKDYKNATEVLSMGMQHFTDWRSLLNLILEDKEHFRLVLGLLRL